MHMYVSNHVRRNSTALRIFCIPFFSLFLTSTLLLPSPIRVFKAPTLPIHNRNQKVLNEADHVFFCFSLSAPNVVCCCPTAAQLTKHGYRQAVMVIAYWEQIVESISLMKLRFAIIY
jgi:hypothetical protein